MPVRAVVRERALVRQFRKRSWWIRASWLIWCTIGPQINHRAQINPTDSSGHRTHELIVVEDVRGTRERLIPASGNINLPGAYHYRFRHFFGSGWAIGVRG